MRCNKVSNGGEVTFCESRDLVSKISRSGNQRVELSISFLSNRTLPQQFRLGLCLFKAFPFSPSYVTFNLHVVVGIEVSRTEGIGSVSLSS